MLKYLNFVISYIFIKINDDSANERASSCRKLTLSRDLEVSHQNSSYHCNSCSYSYPI